MKATRVVRFFVAAGSLVVLAGCGDSGQIKRVIRDSLVDPESARFRGDVVRSADGAHACILVNAKNKMGGYTGFSPVTVDKVDGKWSSPFSWDSGTCGYWFDRLSKK